MGVQRFFVAGRLIGLTVFPTAEIDADKFKAQRTHGRMVAFFALSLLVIELFGPAFFSEGMARIFVKGLAAKFGAAVAHVDDLALAALLFDRSNPVELLRLLGAFKSLAIGPKGDQEPRSHDRSGAGKAAKERGVRISM